MNCWATFNYSYGMIGTRLSGEGGFLLRFAHLLELRGAILGGSLASLGLELAGEEIDVAVAGRLGNLADGKIGLAQELARLVDARLHDRGPRRFGRLPS